jgi:hypothetical protein
VIMETDRRWLIALLHVPRNDFWEDIQLFTADRLPHPGPASWLRPVVRSQTVARPLWPHYWARDFRLVALEARLAGAPWIHRIAKLFDADAAKEAAVSAAIHGSWNPAGTWRFDAWHPVDQDDRLTAAWEYITASFVNQQPIPIPTRDGRTLKA